MSRFKGWTPEAMRRIQNGKIEAVPVKKNKYNARRKLYNGVLYDSTFEAEYAQKLDFALTARAIAGWERQVVLDLPVKGKRICKYIIDFVVTHKDGTKEYIETKGHETAAWKIKRKLFKQIYPELNYRVVKK